MNYKLINNIRKFPFFTLGFIIRLIGWMYLPVIVFGMFIATDWEDETDRKYFWKSVAWLFYMNKL